MLEPGFRAFLLQKLLVASNRDGGA